MHLCKPTAVTTQRENASWSNGVSRGVAECACALSKKNCLKKNGKNFFSASVAFDVSERRGWDGERQNANCVATHKCNSTYNTGGWALVCTLMVLLAGLELVRELTTQQLQNHG
jgi:hypothetical protein